MVCRIFRLLGIPVYDADLAARELMNTDPELIASIKTHFGTAAYDAHGQLDRKYMAEIVFKDKNKLNLLNSLVHPATIRDAEQWAQQQRSPYTIKEAALLFESEAFQYLDKIIGVYAPAPLRILRVMKRDGISREEVMNRMSKQLDENIKMRLCHYVIHNDEQQLVIPQVLQLHEKLLRLASQ